MVHKEIYSFAFPLPLFFPPFVDTSCKLHYAYQYRFRRFEGD